MSRDSKIYNMDDLRQVGLDALEDLRSGKIEINELLAISKACDTVMGTIKTQMEYAKLLRETPHIPFVHDVHKGITMNGEADKTKRLEKGN